MTTTELVSARGRLLVVDDVAANRELIGQELEDAGFEVHLATSGEDCLRQVGESEERFDCILLDIHMPGVDGIETCRRLRASPGGEDLPVVFVTALGADDDRLASVALEAGGNDFLSKPYSPTILLARVGSQVRLARALDRMRKQVITDEVTGLFSRRFLFEMLRRQVKQCSRTPAYVLSCLMVDVDNFKEINDKHGHLEGDRVLRWIAGQLKDASRETDISARFGGEEFAVILPATGPDGARTVAEKIRAMIETRSRETIPTTVSVGVSWLKFDNGDGQVPARVDDVVSELLRQADNALYRAKRGGKNRICLHEDP